MKTIILVQNDERVSTRLSNLIKKYDKVDIIGHCVSEKEVEESLRKNSNVDALLIESNMIDNLLKMVKPEEKYPHIKIVTYSIAELITNHLLGRLYMPDIIRQIIAA